MKTEKPKTPSQTALLAIAYAMAGGAVMIGLVSISSDTTTQRLSVAGAGLLVAGASIMVGGLLGFLFGIPRMLQGSDAENERTRKSSGTNSGEVNVTYRANTNLEQISDWLTKILVGVGLTQLTTLPEKLQSLGAFLAPSLAPAPQAEIIGVSIVLYFVIGGFLFGYLWTRLFLGGALREADVAALGAKISELERQMSEDAKALNLVQQHLNPQGNSREISEEELREAILAASPPARTTIFQQAWEVRSNNWREASTKPRMERTIPIFRALAAGDIRNEFHANHGQLGFALKDERTPDFAEAEKELTHAIEIRGDWRTQGWLLYEFARAVCRIQLDADFKAGNPTSPSNRSKIIEDLAAVASNEELLQRLVSNEPDIATWMQMNQVTTQHLIKQSTKGMIARN